MPITAADWVTRLSETDVTASNLIAEHLLDNENEILLHPLMFNTRSLAIDAYERSDIGLLDRLLAVVETGLTEGDERVQNAVSVSFVEDTGLSDPKMSGFISSWPPALHAEAERQRQGRA